MTGRGGVRGGSILSTVDPDGPFDAVLLFRRTGVLVAGWTRNAAPQDVLSVMAATMFGSVQTLVEALGDPSPSEVAAETRGHRLLAVKCGPQDTLLVVAPVTVSRRLIKRAALSLVRQERMSKSSERTSTREVVVKRSE